MGGCSWIALDAHDAWTAIRVRFGSASVQVDCDTNRRIWAPVYEGIPALISAYCLRQQQTTCRPITRTHLMATFGFMTAVRAALLSMYLFVFQLEGHTSGIATGNQDATPEKRKFFTSFE